MDYKLICIDMDGTLLNDKHEVSERNREAIKKATEKGVHIALTTGRLFTSAKYYSDLIGVKAPIISSNGAYIREKDREEVIYQSVLSEEQLNKVYKVIKKYDFTTAYFNTCDTVISEKIVPENHGYKLVNKGLPQDAQVKFLEGLDFRDAIKERQKDILKAICIEEIDKEKLEKAKAELRQDGTLEVVSSWDNNFEVMAAGTSKGESVKKLAEILGVKREEVICMGDSENDISMIEYAGTGVAMGNALSMVKDRAQYITDTNMNDGVAKAIERLVLEG